MNNIRVALAGNPNSGKTTLFNALTGSHLQVGNYPGVTVEKRESEAVYKDTRFTFTDLPGIYSLTAYSEDEVVARSFLVDERPDFVIDVLDMTNVERNLNLAAQLMEAGCRMVCALNMVEEAEAKGIHVDEHALSLAFHVPFVKINAKTRKGVDALFEAILDLKKKTYEIEDNTRIVNYGEEIESRLGPLEETIEREHTSLSPRALAVKLLEKDGNARASLAEHTDYKMICHETDEAIKWVEGHFAKSSEIVMAEQRFGFIRGAAREATTIEAKPDFSVTEAVDKVIMNPVLALPLFLAVLWGIFQLTFTLGAYPQAGLEALFGLLSNMMNHLLAGFPLARSLVVDGIIAGVGGVFSFVPLIVILFFFLSVLEDLGYMARAAFATDKLLHTAGLHGQSIFPLMLGFGCSVPAIMASRTLKSKRDRVITVLVTPMMSCGAKLPIHVLIAGAFFGKNAGNVVMGIYACGVVLAILSAFLLRRTVLRGEPTPFVLELPPYRLPTLRGLGYHVWSKTAEYLKRAGGVIMAASVLIWALTTFPVHHPSAGETEEEAQEAQLAESFIGQAGRFIEPAFRPLGFNWKMSVATLTGFAAREVVASTLGVLYRVGDSPDEGEVSVSLEEALRADSSITPVTGFAFLLFILLIPPCFAALATIRAELGWRWLAFEVVFLFAIGYIAAFLAAQIGVFAA